MIINVFKSNIRVEDGRLNFFILFYFLFFIFYFLNLGIGFSMISHVTVTNCHREHHKKFQNNDIILYVNSI